MRYYLPLPSYLPLRDGDVVVQEFPSTAEEGGAVPTAVITVHQVTCDPDPLARSDFQAVSQVLERRGHAPKGSGRGPELAAQRRTVFDVVTQMDSPDRPVSVEHARDLGPREDSLMRALAAARDVARAARLTGSTRVVLPSYERLPLLLIWSTAVGFIGEGGTRHIPPDEDWSVRSVMLLEHSNISGWEVTDEHELDALTEQAAHWFRCLQQGFPPAVGREHLLQARRALHVDGEYAQAVLSSATGVEVLCDAMLSALMWEEHKTNSDAPDASRAAALFAMPKYAPRVTQGLVPRLKGDWSSTQSPWVAWRAGGSRMRNRIIHTGYQPTRAEAAEVVRQVDALQAFMFDQLAKQASKYPRVATMMLARDGLDKRGAFVGQVKRFVETQASQESWWLPELSSWHEELIEVASGLDE